MNSSHSATTATATPLRHAIVGIGAGIVSAHMPAYRDLDNVVIVGGADVSATAGQARADELDCPFFLDHRQMLAETKPDVTVVLTPHPFHAAIAIDALNAGSHVLVEKPMAVQVRDADAMIAAADKNNRLLAVNFQQRFRPEVEAARHLIQSGQLGEIQRVTQVEPWLRTVAYYKSAGWRGTWKGEGGGVLMNQAPHSLDLLCHLAGMPKRVVAWNRTVRHSIEVEDSSMAMLEWENGALGSIFFSTAEAGERRMEIVGTGGILNISEGGKITFQRYEPNLVEHILHSPERFAAPQIVAEEVPVGDGLGKHIEVYTDFHRAITEGTPLRADGREGLMSLELANAIIYSSYRGCEVELPLDREGYSTLLAELQAGA
ncbi:MAG TPA: Gfo/Idh/MocA family oxidoreductase [Caldilineaceae bacterium]|nr:Gfo/Idh/MocA family oxidoreductase [Caldilineaceae bacterium]